MRVPYPVLIVWCLTVGELTACGHKPEFAFSFGTSALSEADLERAWSAAVDTRWSQDPRNRDYPFQVPCDDEASILADTVPANGKTPRRFGCSAFEALWNYVCSRNSRFSTNERRVLALKAIDTSARGWNLESAFARRAAVLSALGALDELESLSPSDAKRVRLTVLLNAAEFTQDAGLYLRLHREFANGRDATRTLASLEDAMLSDMRLSTTQHLDGFRAAFAQDRELKLFNKAQERYIQSLFDRYQGSLE
jgi:hypothetical protein